MAIILTIANQKGGVGKTTTSVNLAAALAQRGQRTLLVDLDPQGNATMGSGIDKRRLTRSIYHVMIGLSDVVETQQFCEVGGYYLVPANRELAGAEIELVEFEERETRLKEALDAVADQYDFILIDSPPSLSLLTLNGLCAANGVIIPMQCEYYALEGLTDLVNTIRKVHANFNTNIRIIGILRVMFDSRITLAQQVSAQLEEHFKDKVFRTIIPRNIRLAEAPSHGMPGVNFDPSSRGAQGYMEFAGELIERVPTFRSPVGATAAAPGPRVTPSPSESSSPATATATATAIKPPIPPASEQPLADRPLPTAQPLAGATPTEASTHMQDATGKPVPFRPETNESAPTYTQSPMSQPPQSVPHRQIASGSPDARDHEAPAAPAGAAPAGAAPVETGEPQR